MEAVGYARISKDEKNSISIDLQTTEIQRYAETNGFNLIGIEVDNGISGKDIKHRRAFQRVLELVETKAIDAVIVFKSDRTSRDGRESLDIQSLFQGKKVQYLSVSEGPLCKYEGPLSSRYIDDEFMAYIRAGLNQRERKLISYRTRIALARKREKGGWIPGRPPFGYRFDQGKLVENPAEQKIINRILELRGRGYSIRAIKTQLESECLLNRKNKAFGRNEIWLVIKKAA